MDLVQVVKHTQSLMVQLRFTMLVVAVAVVANRGTPVGAVVMVAVVMVELVLMVMDKQVKLIKAVALVVEAGEVVVV